MGDGGKGANKVGINCVGTGNDIKGGGSDGDLLIRLPVSQKEHLLHMFEVSFPRVATKCQCPFPGNPGLSHTWRGIRNHFNQKHWRDSLMILEEPLPYFQHSENCGRQMPPWIINNRHYNLEQFRVRE